MSLALHGILLPRSGDLKNMLSVCSLASKEIWSIQLLRGITIDQMRGRLKAYMLKWSSTLNTYRRFYSMTCFQNGSWADCVVCDVTAFVFCLLSFFLRLTHFHPSQATWLPSCYVAVIACENNVFPMFLANCFTN